MLVYKSDAWDSGNYLTRFYEYHDICPACDGRGTDEDGQPCPECEGSGQVWWWE